MALSLLLPLSQCLLLFLLSFTTAQEQTQRQIGPTQIPQNPLSLLFVHESSDLTLRFGLGFLEELHLLKSSCYSRAKGLEAVFKDQLQQMTQYQHQTIELMESSGMSDMSRQEKAQIRVTLNQAMNDLLSHQEELNRELTANCSLELQRVSEEKMSAAMSYARSIFSTSRHQYIQFLNQVTAYRKRLRRALDECIETYSPLFIAAHKAGHIHVLGSTSEVCMTVEVEGLIEFIRQFVINAASLLGTSASTGNRHATLNPDSTQTYDLVATPSPTSDHSNHHHHHHNHHHGNHHHGNHHHHGHHGNSPHHHGNHHHHHGHHGDQNSLMPTPTVDRQPRPSNTLIHRPHPSHSYKPHPSNRPHGQPRPSGHPNSRNKPHPTDVPDDRSHAPHSQRPRPSDTRPHPPSHSSRPRPSQLPNVDIIIDVVNTTAAAANGVGAIEEEDKTNHAMALLVICTAFSVAFILAIVIVGMCLIVLRCYMPSIVRKQAAWKQLSEEEKIAQMKQSGYINPTYKFFDQVTQ